MLLAGVLAMVDHYLGFNWWWTIIATGLVLDVVAVGRLGDASLIFPGTILAGTGAAGLALSYGVLHHDWWRIWPLFFCSLGLAFLLTWANRSSGVWVLIPGGIFLVFGGGGLASDSFVRYQLWLHRLIRAWPLLLLATGLIVVITRWRQWAAQQGKSTTAHIQ
jgi:hypothetical protein